MDAISKFRSCDVKFVENIFYKVNDKTDADGFLRIIRIRSLRTCIMHAH